MYKIHIHLQIFREPKSNLKIASISARKLIN